MSSPGRVVSILSLSVLLVACGDDGGAAPGSTGSSTTGSTAAGSTTAGVDGSTDESGMATTETVDEGTADTGYDPPTPMCGNGYIEPGEECDDGNTRDDDGCSSACFVPCGLQWSTLALGPTLDSEILGQWAASDVADRILVAGRLREITVKMDGTELEGDDTVLVHSYDADGGFGWEQVLGTPEGDALPAGVAVDEAGDVYVAATVDAADGGTAIRAVKLAAANGAQVWTHDFDSAFVGQDDRAFDIAVGPDGQPVISGQARVGEGDDDIWIRKLDATRGTEVWTETYSGVGTPSFSTDDGGPIAIGADGTIYVLGTLYEDFETQRAVLLRYEADGGPPTWTFVPTIEGANQTFEAVGVTVDADGSPMMIVSREGGLIVSAWLYRLDTDGQEVWLRTHEDFADPTLGSDWLLEGLALDGDELVVLGRYVNDQQMPGSSWWEAWVSRLSAADATPRCQVRHGIVSEELFPPSLQTFGLAVSSEGSAVATGRQLTSDESALWLGSFRR